MMASPVPVDVIIKLGGSAITVKDKLETLKPDPLQRAAEVVHMCYKQGLQCVIVHGAGSFGHHHAKKFGVNCGFSHLPPEGISNIKTGFCLTHLSVTKLSHIVTETLVKSGVPAVTVSPCGIWKTDSGEVELSYIQPITDLLLDKFVPVLHGDCVLDRSKGSAILSGDTIIKILCSKLSVGRVVFLTDVDGIYNKPPTEEGASLLTNILVSHDRQYLKADISTSEHDCDVTGGIALKMRSAVDIILESHGKTPVFVCRIDSEGAQEACCHGKLDNRLGTFIQLES